MASVGAADPGDEREQRAERRGRAADGHGYRAGPQWVGRREIGKGRGGGGDAPGRRPEHVTQHG